MAKDTPQTAGPIELEVLHAFIILNDTAACAESIGPLARAVDKLTARVEALEKRPRGGCGPDW